MSDKAFSQLIIGAIAILVLAIFAEALYGKVVKTNLTKHECCKLIEPVKEDK